MQEVPARMPQSLQALACCPRCRSELVSKSDSVTCSNRRCLYSDVGFPTANGQPVLIDFDESIFDRAAYTDGRGSVMRRDDSGQELRTKAWALLFGGNRIAPMMCRQMLSALKERSEQPLVLVIGGGAVGAGAAALYEDRDVQLIGTDVYASSNTCLVADAHRLPFKDELFDAVWVQAVLEHVLEPHVVAAEIRRVLKPGGLVYADTPFLQAVHEGAYDFTRFTLSGHRWLFRHFEQIDAGIVGGPGSSLIWAMRYYLRALGLGDTTASIAAFPFFWLRLLDGVMRRQPSADAAVGTYFYGRKTERSLTPRDMIQYYRAQSQTGHPGVGGLARSPRLRPVSAASPADAPVRRSAT